MSAKKSYDIEPRRTASSARKSRKKTAPPKTRRTRKKSLRERREERAQLRTGVFVFVALLVVVGIIYLFWRPEARIMSVRAEGTPFEEEIESLAFSRMEGAYYGIIPRDSFFFFPEKQIEAAVLEAYPGVFEVYVSRAGLTALQISLKSRESAFIWCGEPGTAAAETAACYEADETGFIYSSAPTQNVASSSLLRVYAALDTASTTDAYPLRAHVQGTDKIDDILRFSRSLESLGVPLRSIAIRGDEADVYTQGGTRITYVVGKEYEAAESAEAALPKVNVMDGSVEYVDLRFPGKAYLKRSGEEAVE